MNTASVLSFRLSGSGTRNVTTPQIPTKSGGQVGVGRSPSLHAAAATASATPHPERRLGMRAIFESPRRIVNLTPLGTRNTLMPLCRSTSTAARSAASASASKRGSRSTAAGGPPAPSASRARWNRCSRRSSRRRSARASAPFVFERLRDALRAALDAATPPGNLRDLAHQMREAVVEAKLAVQETRDAVARTERELAQEGQRLADAERRGRLAGEIRDQETVDVAGRFAAKHRERAGVLERKLAALREELALYERELAEMQAQLVRAERNRPATEAERSAERAWRDLQAAGGARPGTDVQDELLQSDLDRAAREAAAERQLKELKKKMKRD